MTKSTDNVCITSCEGNMAVRSTYEDYVVVVQNDVEQSPSIFMNADPILLARAAVMTHYQFLLTYINLPEDVKEVVKDQLIKDGFGSILGGVLSI